MQPFPLAVDPFVANGRAECQSLFWKKVVGICSPSMCAMYASAAGMSMAWQKFLGNCQVGRKRERPVARAWHFCLGKSEGMTRAWQFGNFGGGDFEGGEIHTSKDGAKQERFLTRPSARIGTPRDRNCQIDGKKSQNPIYIIFLDLKINKYRPPWPS